MLRHNVFILFGQRNAHAPTVAVVVNRVEFAQENIAQNPQRAGGRRNVNTGEPEQAHGVLNVDSVVSAGEVEKACQPVQPPIWAA